ncbi:Uma2 family endonuclease [Streptomyces sp. PR69]|uniref:Uma2 family endonuclease n=1 Tax=Streptomyces sp. PR69 TaxID=2984950 RepID=UPI002264B655|nr:Uma2 family endonuclease [Streptomyces sp. PR69]
MTVVEADRIEMANSSDELTLDTLFEWLEKMPVPEGYKTEIVGGHIFMSPQRDVHWNIIRRIVRALEDRFGMDAKIMSDVRIDFPGDLNGFAPDVVLLSDNAEKNAHGRWNYQDVQFVAEVISKNTALNDYGPKKAAYAEAKVPAYLIINPYTGKCVLHTTPKNGDYDTDARFTFGDEIDLTHTPAGLTLATDDFPRD